MLIFFKKFLFIVLFLFPELIFAGFFNDTLKDDDLGLVIHDVKQGSASTILFPLHIHDDGTKESFVMVYDAGTSVVGGAGLPKEERKVVGKEMAELVLSRFQAEPTSSTSGPPVINRFFLILSHGDADHISLVKLLLKPLKKLKKSAGKEIHHKMCLLGGCRNEFLFQENGQSKKVGEECLKAIESFFDSHEIFFSAEHSEPPILTLGPEITSSFLFWKFIETALDANSSSLVLRLAYRNQSIVFLGDADAQTEATLLARLCETSIRDKQPVPGLITTLVVLSHHGALLNGCNGLLITLLQPKAIAISVGEENTYGHPQERTLRQAEASPSLETVTLHTLYTHKTSSQYNRKEPWMGDPKAASDPFSTDKAIYATWPMGTLEFLIAGNEIISLPI